MSNTTLRACPPPIPSDARYSNPTAQWELNYVAAKQVCSAIEAVQSEVADCMAEIMAMNDAACAQRIDDDFWGM